jgi:WD40 repeat protein
MNLNRRTLFLIITGTAAIVFIALGVLWYANRPDTTKTVKNLFGILPQIGTPGGGGASTDNQQPATDNTEENEFENENGETATEAELLQIVQKPVLGATLTADKTRIMYYARAGGKLESVDFSGEAQEQISPLTIVGTFDIVWQDAKRKSIVSYLDDTTIKRFINTTATTGIAFLPEGVSSFDFSPDSRSLAYLLQKGGTTQLITATEDGKNPRVVYETPIPDFSLSWVAPKKILLQSAPSNQAPGIAYLFDTGTRIAENLFSGIRANATIANTDGTTLVTSFAETNGQIALVRTNQKGENPKIITPATLAEKCVFAEDTKTIFCAISQNGADLPDAWLRGDAALEDQFVRIPSDTLIAEAISNKTPLDAINLFLSPDEQYLFFQDKNDLTLWRLKLK